MTDTSRNDDYLAGHDTEIVAHRISNLRHPVDEAQLIEAATAVLAGFGVFVGRDQPGGRR